MSTVEAIAPGNVAVITGGADGIGLAAARYFLSQGVQVCIADNDSDQLEQLADSDKNIRTFVVDVSQQADVERLRDEVVAEFGGVHVLMNNAGVVRHCGSWTELEAWKAVVDVNLWGVIHGVHAFAPQMIAQNTPSMIINTGSKQGITTPPGNPAYNVTKAGVKAVTEALAYELRNTENCQVSAHLLVPGFTYTGMVRKFLPEKPPGAWTAEQVIEHLVERLANNDFYIICPDNDATWEMDQRRMAWAMGDLVENRPALSRWHPDYEAQFEQFMQGD